MSCTYNATIPYNSRYTIKSIHWPFTASRHMSKFGKITGSLPIPTDCGHRQKAKYSWNTISAAGIIVCSTEGHQVKQLLTLSVLRGHYSCSVPNNMLHGILRPQWPQQELKLISKAPMEGTTSCFLWLVHITYLGWRWNWWSVMSWHHLRVQCRITLWNQLSLEEVLKWRLASDSLTPTKRIFQPL